jgi:hypothetical protein
VEDFAASLDRAQRLRAFARDNGAGERETLMLVLSEMGRTPSSLPTLGKDHWPVTSAMLLGAGVRAPTFRKCSRSAHSALRNRLATAGPSAPADHAPSCDSP